MNTVQDNLMYCDLVSVNGIIHKVGVDGNCFRIVDAEGIPLTPEILEKNGFYDRNTQWYYKRFGSYVCFDIAISLVYREIEVSKICGAATYCLFDETATTEIYALSLRVALPIQILRLCGLNELADNFKV